MKGKTVTFIRNGDFRGLCRHLFRKHVVNHMALPLYSFLVPRINRILAPVSRDIQAGGIVEATSPSDISDHLPALFCEVLKSGPSLVVELGTRGGDSTRALLKAASIAGAKMVSVDINDCRLALDSRDGGGLWHFVQADDVAFAVEFAAWCGERDMNPTIDVLFIDTSHEYAHTRLEIDAWFPFLSENGKVIFHDTHMGDYYRRKNGGIVRGWDNQRGVIRAIEETMGVSYDETRAFIDVQDGWLIEHTAYSSGLTIMTRIKHG